MGLTRRRAVGAVSLLACGGLVRAQTFPNRPIKLIYNYAPGGPGDAMSRALAAALSKYLNQQPVVVENRVGAAGSIGLLAAARSAPDGYTITLSSLNTFIQVPLVTKDSGFDPVTEMAPLVNLGNAPLVLAAHPSVPVNDFPGFVEWARQQPSGVDVAISGTTLELASALLAQQAGIKLVNVAYRGQGPSLLAVLAGETKIFFNSVSGALQQTLKEGKLKVLGVTTAQPSPLIPGGEPLQKFLPGYVQDINYAMWAPKNTPPDILATLREAISKALKEPDMQEKFFNSGVVLTPAGPDEVIRITRREITTVKKILETTSVNFEK